MIYPMFAMVILTILVGLVIFRARVRSVKSGAVRTRSYKPMDSDTFSEDVIQTGRNFNNQFEIPVLFYVAALAYLHFGLVDAPSLCGAWVFVASRYAHSYVHINHNHILHRPLAFWTGVIAVLILWLYLVAPDKPTHFSQM